MDSLTYHYNKGTNQLAQVTDVIPSTYYTVDIDNETSHHNYRYNGIGELASDSIAGIDTIMWTIYHKVHKIVKTNNDSIVFVYDPLGNRLLEKYFLHTGTSDTTKYVRDAQGNIMAIYDRKKDTVRLTEWDIYGSSRIGSLDTLLRMQKPVSGHGTIDSLTISYLERQKQYELTNHLGNVLVTVSDGKTPIDTLAGHDTISYYLPIVINAQDYYPFGMVQPGRSYTLSNDSAYKYLFNGKLHDDNIYGKDNSYDYGARFYDPRLGRTTSTDKAEKKYAYQSPYSMLQDNPIGYIDPDGNTVVPATDAENQAFSKRLDNVFSGDIASLRQNFSYEKVGTRVVTSKDENGNVTNTRVDVYGFTFKASGNIKTINDVYKAIRKSGLKEDQKTTALAYATVINDFDAVLISNGTGAKDKSTAFSINLTPDHADIAEQEDKVKKGIDVEKNKDLLTNGGDAFVPSQPPVKLDQGTGSTGAAVINGGIFVKDLSDKTLDEAIIGYATNQLNQGSVINKTSPPDATQKGK